MSAPIQAETMLEVLRRMLDGATPSENVRSGIAVLLGKLALEQPPARPCAACGKMIWFFRTAGDRLMPIDDGGVAHFATCAKPELFRRPR